MITTISGTIYAANQQPLSNVLIRFTLKKTGYEGSNTYPEGTTSEVYSQSDGSFSLSLWANSGSVNDAPYLVEISESGNMIASFAAYVPATASQTIEDVITASNLSAGNLPIRFRKLEDAVAAVDKLNQDASAIQQLRTDLDQALSEARDYKHDTLAGYGITDAYTKNESDNRYIDNSNIYISGRGTLVIKPQDDNIEGGQIKLQGSPNQPSVNIDTYAGEMRVYNDNTGVVRFSVTDETAYVRGREVFHRGNFNPSDYQKYTEMPTMIVSAGNGTPSYSQDISGTNFARLILPDLRLDTHGGWDANNNIYTVPATGLYRIDMKFRVKDAPTKNVSYGIGADTSEKDSPSFQWTSTNGNREGLENSRLMQLNQGDLIRMFYYWDAPPYQIVGAELAIYRIR